MVIRTAVKLAHIVCAVFSLSRPRGVTRYQIYKFCSLHFNIRQDRRQFTRALQRAEDEDLISCFQQRYRLGTASGGSEILWSQKWRKHQGRRRKRTRAGGKLSITRACKKRLEARREWFQSKKEDYLEKRRREGVRRRKCKKDKSRLRCTKKKSVKGVILCKSFSHGKRKGNHKITVSRRSARMRNKKQVEISKLTRRKKNNVRSKRDHHGKRKCLKNGKQFVGRRKRSKASKSKKSCQKRTRRDIYREALRRPKRTVAHAESWDRINYSQLRNERENQDLMKDSNMVQRILSVRHGPSWDDLNKELRRIKSTRSCNVTSGKKPARTRKGVKT